MNADGSKIAVASAKQVTFTDRSFNVEGTVQIPGANGGLGKTEFSPDGSRLFIYYGENTGLAGVEAIDANSMTNLGYYSATIPVESTDLSFLDVDTNGRLYFGADGGVRVTDTTAPPVPVAADANMPGSSCPNPYPNYFPLNTATQIPFQGNEAVASGSELYLGGLQATVPSTGVENSIDIPVSSVAGPVGLECIDPSGFTSTVPAAISYGVQISAVSANLLPAIGTPIVDVFGYGILDQPYNSNPTVTVNGGSAQVLGTNSDLYLGSLQGAAIQLPQGTPGAMASISVASANGSGTLSNAASYIPQTTIVPASGLRQLL